MAVQVTTGDGANVLKDIAKQIDEGKIQTWRYIDQNGVRYYTHSAEQWDGKAWLKASLSGPGLVFNIIPSKDKTIDRVVYGIFHGRMVEMLLNHFDTRLSQAAATAMPATGDQVK